jgi:3-(3-hydroxy-phenyl)propionate hydroxylase
VVLDDNNVVSVGSRAICWAKRTLEIFDRLGVARADVEKGVTWKVGRHLSRDKQRSTPSTCCPRTGTSMPAFINLQQYYVEEYLSTGRATSPT